MVFISATRLRVKSMVYLIPFFIANERCVKQLKRSAGFLGGQELVDKGLTFWTLTMWSIDTDMKGFRNGTQHRKAMQKLPYWCNEASYVHWEQEDARLPDWQTVYTKMIADGKITKVRQPSANQLNKNYPPIKRPGAARNFKARI
jgi:hypothetical protein